MPVEVSTSKPSSGAQTKTSYPSGPSRTNPPRTKLIGGFILDNVTCAAWGSRLCNRSLNPEILNDCLAAYSRIIDKVEAKPYNTYFAMVGPEDEPHMQYMIVTQSKTFRGWEGMDPRLIPKFEEGEREAIAQKLLEAEGVTQYEFGTVLW